MSYDVLGIDQSLTETGSVILRSDATFDAYTIRSKHKGVDRLVDIESQLLKVLQVISPSIVVMEGYAFNPRAGQSFSLGELGGIIKRMCAINGLRRISVAPGTLKKYVTGDGSAKKNMMLLGAFQKFGVKFTNDNVCDAYCLARLGQEFLIHETVDMKKIPKNFRDIYKAVVKYNDLIK